MSQVELRRLRYFVAVAEELHFGRAALRLHMAQPPLSQQIRKLEDDLGVRLFDRTRRKVELTREGRLLLPEAQRAIAAARRLETLALQVAQGSVGRLDVAYVSSGLFGSTPMLIRKFGNLYPNVSISLEERTTAQQLQMLLRGEIDVGFLRPPVEDDQIRWAIVETEPIVVALPEDHPLVDRHAIDLSDLAGEPLILFPRDRGPGHWNAVVEACLSAGFSPNIVYEPTEVHTRIGLVAAGAGIALVPDSASALSLPGVVYQRIVPVAPVIDLAIARLASEPSPLLDRFVRFVESGGEDEREVEVQQNRA